MESYRLSLRERLHRQLDPQARDAEGLSGLNRIVVALIVVSSVVAIVGTEALVTAGREELFSGLEFLFAFVFLVEYGLRLWVAPLNGRYGRGWRASLRYAITPAAVLDLLAILPVLLMFAGGNLFLLRLARVARLLRLARLGRFSSALDNIRTAISSRRYELILSFAVAAILLLLSSTLVHLFEAEAQPEAFGSIPRAMWWSLATLTTVGYGDVVPITFMGRVFAGLTAIFGIGLIAMPTGILASAFSDAIQNSRRTEKEKPDYP